MLLPGELGCMVLLWGVLLLPAASAVGLADTGAVFHIGVQPPKY